MNSIAKNEKLPDSFKDDVPIVMHPSLQFMIGAFLYEKFGERKYFGDCLAMYTFLYQTARHQGNIQVWANRNFVTKALSWTTRKFAIIRDLLEEMGLVEFIETKNDNLSGKKYWKINHVWKPERIELMGIEESMKAIGDMKSISRDDIVRINLMKDLLIQGFGTHGTIETSDCFEFFEALDGVTDLKAYNFTFEGKNNKLIAHGGFEGEEDFAYTVPTYMLEEVLKFILEDVL